MTPDPPRSNAGSTPHSTPTPAQLPPIGAETGLEQLDGVTEHIALPDVLVTIERTNLVGAQPTDPPWARILFLLFQDRDVRWWRVILMVAPLWLLLVSTLGGLLIMIAILLPGGSWISGVLGIGSVTGGTLALHRRRRNSTSYELTAQRGET
jgi:hypothetical protein